MYSVLLVDDEPIARQSLLYLVDWEAHGFKVEGEAENGSQALELLKERRFALVLTDIRMPVLNGLDMIARMKEFSDARIIILSGYDEFEYARQGMKMGVQDYLLKPVDEDELITVLDRIRLEIDHSQQSSRRERLSMSALQEQSLYKIMHGQGSRSSFGDHLQLLGIPLVDCSFYVLLVEMDAIGDAHTELSERDIELKRYAVRNILEELSSGGYVFLEAEDRFGILHIGGSIMPEPEQIHAKAEEIKRLVRLYAKESVTIGLGYPVQVPEEIPGSFRSAEEALDGKFLTGHGSILSGQDQMVEMGNSPMLRELETEVLEAVKSGAENRVEKALATLREGFMSEGLGASQVKIFVLELLVQLFRLVKEAGISHTLVFDYRLDDYGQVMRVKTIEELLLLVENKCVSVMELLCKSREVRPHKVLEEVKRLMQEQYTSSASLRSIALQVYMNPNYLGKLFKTHTGQSFNDFLLQIRMEQAKHLLLHTDKKVYEIANEVGFVELDWFYMRFKSYTGYSTGEFRSLK